MKSFPYKESLANISTVLGNDVQIYTKKNGFILNMGKSQSASKLLLKMILMVHSKIGRKGEIPALFLQ